MEIQYIHGILTIFALGIACAAGSGCSEKDFNTCLLAFVFAHSQHQGELTSAKECKLQLLDCSELDKTYKCLNKQGLSEPCANSLEDIINKYIADLNIPCTVEEFNSHCPHVTQINSQKVRTTTPAASKSNVLIATWVGVITSILLSVGMK